MCVASAPNWAGRQAVTRPMVTHPRVWAGLAALGLVLWSVHGDAAAPATTSQPASPPAVASGAPVPLHPGANTPAPTSFADLAERLLPAVVNISTTQNAPARASGKDSSKNNGREGGKDRDKDQARPGPGPDLPMFPPGSPFEDFFRDFFDREKPGQEPNAPSRRATSLGSGFIVDAQNGYVITNNHVIQDADEITVRLQDDTNIKAEVVGRDSKTDLALLRIKTDHPLVAVPLGDSDRMRVGDWVVAIGNPFGLGGSVTAGIISARARDIQAGPYDDFLQTDASINRGNSGGPMFNLAGEVIGINTAIFSPTGGSVGIGFAIPSSMAKGVIEQLKQYGRTRRGWLGVRIQAVTPEIAENLGLPKAHGALVASTTPNGPAARAGIQPGDIVTSFDGKDIAEMRRLPRVVAETLIDKQVPVVVWRKGQTVTVDVKVGELEAAEESGAIATADEPAPRSASKPVEVLGLKLVKITPELRQQFELGNEINGVLVQEVDPGSPAADKGMIRGDVILEVGQEEVAAPDDVASRVKKARDQGKKSVLLLVDRKGDLRFVALGAAQ